jgi:acylphosphatase
MVVSVTPAFRCLFMSVVLGVLASGCAYSFRGSLPPGVGSVQVVQFRSTVTEFGLEQEITSQVTELIVSDGRVSIDNSSPDARIEGTISSFTREAVAYTGSEQVQEYRLDIRISVSMDRTRDNDYILRNESVADWVVYDPGAESYESARDRLVTQISELVVRACLSGW